MLDTVITGPYRYIEMDSGPAPLYIIPYDKEGQCQVPVTLRNLLADAATHDYTDIFLVSHGWNNSFKDAVASYNSFITGYQELQRQPNIGPVRAERPLLVGVHWPSAVLV